MIDLSALREKPTLAGERVNLVPISAEHADGFFESTRDEEVRRLTGSHRRPGYEEVREWCATRADQFDRLDLAIIEEPGGRFVGALALEDVDVDNQSAGYRIALSAIEFTGQGIGKEATRLVLDYAFNRVRLHRVWLNVYAFNMRAIAVYRSYGFTVEGRLRDALLWDERRHDALIMAVLESEFRGAGD